MGFQSDSESGNPVSYLSLIVIIPLSHLVSEIFACNTQTYRWTDNAESHTNDTITHSWRPHCGGPTNNNKNAQLSINTAD